MTTIENDDRLLIPRLDICRKLSIGETKFWELEKSGQLEVVRIGRRSYVPAASLHEYIERLRAAASETVNVANAKVIAAQRD